MNIERVVREVTVVGKVQGMDQVERGYNQVTAASERNSRALADNARGGSEAERALADLSKQLADNFRQQQQLTDAIRMQAQATQQIVAANDNVRESSRQTGVEIAQIANHLKQVGAAAYALSPTFRAAVNEAGSALTRTLSPAVEGAMGVVVLGTNRAGQALVSLGASAARSSPQLVEIGAGVSMVGARLATFSPAATSAAASVAAFLAPISAVLGPLLLLYHAVTMTIEAWKLSGEAMQKHIDLAKKASDLQVSTDFYQRIVKGAEAAKLPVDALTEAFDRLKAATADQLGGASGVNRLEELTKAGNFGDNSGVDALRLANSQEERFRAVVSLIDQAMAKGERLAALDVAKTFLGDRVAQNLAKDSDYLTKMQIAADKVAATDIIPADQIARSAELQSRLDAAEKILSQKWHPIQDLLVEGGFKMRQVWVWIVEQIAAAFDWAAKLLDTIGNSAVFKWIADRMSGGSVDPMEDARKRLGTALQTPGVQQSQMTLTRSVQTAVRGDTSIDPASIKNVKEVKDAYDRAEESLLKYIETTKAAADAVGKGVYEQERLKAIAQLTAAGIKDGLTPEAARARAELSGLGEQAGKAAQKLAEARLASDIKFNFDTAFLSDADKQIASILRQTYGDNKWQSMMDGPIAGSIRFNNMLSDINQTIRSSAASFANDLVSGIMSGKSAMESLQGAATSLGKSLTQAGINNIIKDPTSPVGYVEAGIGVLAQMFGGADESKKKLEEAKRVWKESGPAFEQFLTQMSGGVQGQLMSKIASARETVRDLGGKAWEAGDFAAVGRMVQAYLTMIHTTARNFIATMDATERGLADGLGMDSPFLKAVQTVKDQLTSVQSFVDDVRTSTGLLSGALSDDTFALTGNADAIAYMNGEVSKASGAAQAYLLSLLGTTPQLSDVATRMLDIQGRAAALQGALEQLGMSSGAAAAAIAGGVQKAIDDLRKSFESGLTSRLNVATGKGYFNDTLTLLAQRDQDVADAAKLGLDMNLVSTVFAAEAQKIVDDAGLVGDAFTSFITIFPELSGVVSQSRTEIEKAATELQTFMLQTAKTITSYLQGLKTGANSTLSPQAQLAEAQSYFNAQLALAQGGNRDALSNITQVAQTLLDQAKSFYASSSGYTRIYDQVTAALQGLVGTSAQTIVSADARAIITSIDTNAASADALAAMQNTLAAQQLSYLQVQQSLLSAIRDLTNSNVEQITLLRTALNPGSISVNVPPAEGRSNVTLSNQMVEALNKIAWNTYATAKNTQISLGLDHDYYSAYGGLYARGGVIPGYASGGMIANGLYGIDSVVARLPNGRPIGLAGGEGVLTAPATQAIGGGAMIDYINRNLRLPTNDNGAASRENFRALAQWNRADADRIIAKLDEVLAVLEVAPQRTSDATRRVVAAMKQRAM